MPSVEPTPALPPPPACPTCGGKAIAAGLITDRGVTTGNYTRGRQHIWITRWMAVAA